MKKEVRDDLTEVCWEESRRAPKRRWSTTNYKLVLEEIDLMDGSPDRYDSLKEVLISWMVDNKEDTLIEEGKDILDGMETLLTEDGSEISEEIIKDTTEMITTIVVCRDLELVNAAPIFQQAGKVRIERMNRLRKSEGL